jgi:hypothetical protein
MHVGHSFGDHVEILVPCQHYQGEFCNPPLADLCVLHTRALEVISISKRGLPLLFLCDRRVSLCARLRRALVELIEDLFTQTI